MTDPLAELDRAARAFSDASWVLGKQWGGTPEAWGSARVNEERARKRYEEALEAVRAREAELLDAVLAGIDLAMRVGDGENTHSPLASIVYHKLRAAFANEGGVRAQMQERSR